MDINDINILKQDLIIEINKLAHKFELSSVIPDDYFEPGMMENLDQYYGSYVPYKIGKLQIQDFSEPTIPKNKITELSHFAEGRPVKTTGGLFAWKARKEAEIF